MRFRKGVGAEVRRVREKVVRSMIERERVCEGTSEKNDDETEEYYENVINRRSSQAQNMVIEGYN